MPIKKGKSIGKKLREAMGVDDKTKGKKEDKKVKKGTPDPLVDIVPPVIPEPERADVPETGTPVESGESAAPSSDAGASERNLSHEAQKALEDLGDRFDQLVSKVEQTASAHGVGDNPELEKRLKEARAILVEKNERNEKEAQAAKEKEESESKPADPEPDAAGKSRNFKKEPLSADEVVKALGDTPGHEESTDAPPFLPDPESDVFGPTTISEVESAIATKTAERDQASAAYDFGTAAELQNEIKVLEAQLEGLKNHPGEITPERVQMDSSSVPAVRTAANIVAEITDVTAKMEKASAEFNFKDAGVHKKELDKLNAELRELEAKDSEPGRLRVEALQKKLGQLRSEAEEINKSIKPVENDLQNTKDSIGNVTRSMKNSAEALNFEAAASAKKRLDELKQGLKNNQDEYDSLKGQLDELKKQISETEAELGADENVDEKDLAASIHAQLFAEEDEEAAEEEESKPKTAEPKEEEDEETAAPTPVSRKPAVDEDEEESADEEEEESLHYTLKVSAEAGKKNYIGRSADEEYYLECIANGVGGSKQVVVKNRSNVAVGKVFELAHDQDQTINLEDGATLTVKLKDDRFQMVVVGLESRKDQAVAHAKGFLARTGEWLKNYGLDLMAGATVVTVSAVAYFTDHLEQLVGGTWSKVTSIAVAVIGIVGSVYAGYDKRKELREEDN